MTNVPGLPVSQRGTLCLWGGAVWGLREAARFTCSCLGPLPPRPREGGGGLAQPRGRDCASAPSAGEPRPTRARDAQGRRAAGPRRRVPAPPGTRGRPPTPSSHRLTAGGLSRRPASALRAHLLPPRKLLLASYAPRQPATFCPTAPPPGSLTPERSAGLCADVRRLQGPGKLAVATPTVPRVRPAAPPALWEAPSRSPTELQDEPAACT